ncbi:MAG TPA: sigma 54-interacting transcriptional regulator [Gemmatimonadales bacterium]|nr:sigma 54-interacting transcriptional regulator [Gemmatimonadales bacterium]
MIVGVSPAIRRAEVLAERYARTRLPILLVGATGTGKELFAQHIHERSGRPGPLVDVNCCALPRDMVESLLFGHRRGAFTGAVESSVGHFERSDGGTLFLDELASLAPDAQGKLLRALDTGEIQPLGGGAKRRVDLRVVGAAQDDISTALDNGRLRRDLFQRVAGVVIELPPLVARLEDVLPLARHFAELDGRRLGTGVERVLLNYSWPGNVRELRLTIERAGQLVDNGIVPSSALAEALALGTTATLAAPEALDERATLAGICESHEWKGGEIARALGISRTTLHRRLRDAGLSLRHAKKYHFVPRCSEQFEATDCPAPPPLQLSRSR